MSVHHPRRADGRPIAPPHPIHATDPEWVEALFPGSMAAWDRMSHAADVRYHIVVDWPHLAMEDGRCWSNHHHPVHCDCHVWTGTGWAPWIRRDA